MILWILIKRSCKPRLAILKARLGNRLRVRTKAVISPQSLWGQLTSLFLIDAEGLYHY